MPANDNVDGFTSEAQTALIVTIIGIMFYVLGCGIALHSVKGAEDKKISLPTKDDNDGRWEVTIRSKVYTGWRSRFTGFAGEKMYEEGEALMMEPMIDGGDVRRRVSFAASKLNF